MSLVKLFGDYRSLHNATRDQTLEVQSSYRHTEGNKTRTKTHSRVDNVNSIADPNTAMSTPTFPTALRLTDLPHGVLYHILSFLCDKARPPRIPIGLQSAEILDTPLPSDLLSVALASPILSAVTADLLGSRAAYLTEYVARKHLPEWVTALGYHVKAVSTLGLLQAMALHPQNLFNRHFYNDLCTDSLLLFRALSGDMTRLEVLDLQCVPFNRCNGMEDAVLQGLVQALESNGPSLRELSLPVSKLCGDALEMVTLSKLEVLTLMWSRNNGCPGIRSGMAFIYMLQAVDGHANRSRKLNTLRELRLMRMSEAPCKSIAESGCSPGLFAGIRTLRMDLGNFRERDYNIEEMFISLFQNLECLYWNFMVSKSALEFINTTCTSIKELHVCPSADWRISARVIGHRTSRALINWNRLEHFGVQIKLKTLLTAHPPNLGLMRIIGEKCPMLEKLAIGIQPENVVGLEELLGRDCRQIRGLHLTIWHGVEDDGWQAYGWQALTKAVQGASHALCEMLVETWRFRYRCVGDADAECAVRCMIAILEHLGMRAKRVVFRLPIYIPRWSLLAEGICDVLRTCILHTGVLECLEADFHMKGVESRYADIENEEKAPFLMLLKEKQRLLEALPRLYRVKLGDLDKHARKVVGDTLRG